MFFQLAESREGNISRSSSLSGIQMRRIHHKESFVIADKLDPNANHGKIMHKKLQMYEELDKTVKYTKSNKPVRA